MNHVPGLGAGLSEAVAGGGAVPVTKAGLEQLANDARNFAGARLRTARRMGRVLGLSLGVVSLVALAEAGGIVSMLPLVRVVPVFVYTHHDGTFQSSVTMSTLPGTLNEANIRALLWQYVVEREGYMFGDAHYRYDVVSGMSALHVRNQYQAWANAGNPNSYLAKLGRKADITVGYIDSGWVSHANDFSTGVYEIRFERVIRPTDAAPAVQKFKVRFEFVKVDSLPLIERVTVNPSGIQVTDYPGPEPLGTPYATPEIQ